LLEARGDDMNRIVVPVKPAIGGLITQVQAQENRR
jgi:hypothetical protein